MFNVNLSNISAIAWCVYFWRQIEIVMRRWFCKRGGLSWGGPCSSILSSLCIWNLTWYKGGLWWEWSFKRGEYCIILLYFYFIFTETVCTVRSNRISWCGFQKFFSRNIKRIWKFGKNWYVPYIFHLWISCIIFYSKINYLFFYYMTMFQVCRITSLIGGKLYLKVRG